MWFYEKLSMGKWSPVTQPDKPTIVTLGERARLKGVNGVGAEIRSLREIPTYVEHLTLGQLAEIYGADGRFKEPVRKGA